MTQLIHSGICRYFESCSKPWQDIYVATKDVAVPVLNLWYDFEASQYYVGFLENCLHNKMLNCVFPDVTVRINTCNTHINKG